MDLRVIHMLLPNLMVMTWGLKVDGNKLTWKVEKKVHKYGQDLSLFCKVENCCNKSAGWGRWTSASEFNTIVINVKNINVDKNSKYDGDTNKTGFTLVIRNISKQDLNTSYSCTYGFLVSKRQMINETDAFFDVPVVDNDGSRHRYLYIIIPLSLIVPVCLIGSVVTFVYKKKKKDADKQGQEVPLPTNENNVPSQQQQELKDDLNSSTSSDKQILLNDDYLERDETIPKHNDVDVNNEDSCASDISSYNTPEGSPQNVMSVY